MSHPLLKSGAPSASPPVTSPEETTKSSHHGDAAEPRTLLREFLSPTRRPEAAMFLIGICLAAMLILTTFDSHSRLGRVFFTGMTMLLGTWGWWKGYLKLDGIKPLPWAVLAVFATMALSALWSIDPAFSIRNFLEQHLWYGLLLILVGAWAVTPGRQLLYLRGLLAAGAISSVLGIILYFTAEQLAELGLTKKAENFVYYSFDEQGNAYTRAQGTLESYTRSALVFVLTLPATLALGLRALRQGKRWEVVLCAAVALVSVYYMLLTKSRGAWLTAAGACAITFILMRGRWWVAAASVAAVAILIALLPTERSRAMTLISHANNPELLFSGRFELWQQGVQPIRENLWTGVGYGGDIFKTDAAYALGYNLYNHRSQSDLHSLYLQTLAEVGIIGSAAYLFLIGTLLVLGWRAVRVEWESPALLGVPVAAGIFVSLLICGVIYYYNESPVAHLVWPTVGLLVAGAWRHRQAAKGSGPNSQA